MVARASQPGRMAASSSGICIAVGQVPACSLRLIRCADGEEWQRLAGHNEVVLALAISPDGRWAISGSYSHEVILWDLGRGKLIQRLMGHAAAVTSVAFSPDRELIGSADANGMILIWQRRTGEIVRRYVDAVGTVLALAFTPGGRSFLTAVERAKIVEWRLDIGREALMSWITENRHVAQPELGDVNVSSP